MTWLDRPVGQWTPQPATRVALALGAAALVLGSDTPMGVLAEAAALAGVIVALGLGRAWAAQARQLLPMLLVLAAIGLVTGDARGAALGVTRLVLLAGVFLTLFRTTAPEDLGESLTRVGAPARFAFILTSAFQFVPVLQRAAADVRDAQRSRGVRLEGDLRSLPNYAALLVPLLAHALKLADDLAEALESRGYSRAGRTPLSVARFGLIDAVGLAAALGLAALGFVV